MSEEKKELGAELQAIVDYYNGNMQDVHQIDGNIWMGSAPIKKVDDSFDYIINLYAGARYSLQSHQVMVFALMNDEALIPNERLLHNLADTAVEFAKRGKTLIHCQAGLNRSGLITGLTLIKQGMHPQIAIDLIRRKRSPQALFNKTFADWLLAQKREE